MAPSSSRSSDGWTYLAIVAVLIAGFPALPVLGRDLDYVLVSLVALPPVIWGLRRAKDGNRGPWWFLASAFSVYLVMNVTWFLSGHGPMDGSTYLAVSHLIGVLGKVLMLGGAVNVVARRGRADLGGIIDTTIISMTLGLLLWDWVLLPHMTATGKGLDAMGPMCISVFVLTGVLGALIRLLQTAGQRIPALWLLTTAIALVLTATVSAELFDVPATGPRPPWTDMMFMAAFAAVGGVGLTRSSDLLVEPGPAPRDELTSGRLAFLGLALASIPVVGGLHQIVGERVDGLLLALGGAAVVPLVMVRVGRLSAQRARAEQALMHQATHDALTGLPNRREFVLQLNAALDDRVRSRPTVLFCDLDGFKAVNDRLGHAAGDALLVEVAARLRSAVRGTDLVSRFGGDEFVVLCRDGGAPDDMSAIPRIGAELSRPIVIAGEAVRVGTSIGAGMAEPGDDAETLINRADSAMYEAKERRRTRPATPAPVH
ncbi:diguanylate cyclase domain-containing protein [Krasilnikovia sp. MM14-A1259]|uniref:diguanylate cyclase domain-containing protein n=1 Tax=Krasilnikovia sp. MM14-A1259 TaxID=3373539 RepID=UPI0038230204